jgi:hypothetical protein
VVLEILLLHHPHKEILVDQEALQHLDLAQVAVVGLVLLVLMVQVQLVV